ncbi:MAG TPA: hypothetical protein VMF67_03155 [Rhizomicrobium sp.]|nr:hypothetical protein [Rhizomicrobium sp.]
MIPFNVRARRSYHLRFFAAHIADPLVTGYYNPSSGGGAEGFVRMP